MNKEIEEIKAYIHKHAERFGPLDRVVIYTELIESCDEGVRDAMKEEYGTTGWEDEK